MKCEIQGQVAFDELLVALPGTLFSKLDMGELGDFRRALHFLPVTAPRATAATADWVYAEELSQRSSGTYGPRWQRHCFSVCRWLATSIPRCCWSKNSSHEARRSCITHQMLSPPASNRQARAITPTGMRFWLI